MNEDEITKSRLKAIYSSELTYREARLLADKITLEHDKKLLERLDTKQLTILQKVIVDGIKLFLRICEK